MCHVETPTNGPIYTDVSSIETLTNGSLHVNTHNLHSTPTNSSIHSYSNPMKNA